jgi:hypothetical protein
LGGKNRKTREVGGLISRERRGCRGLIYCGTIPLFYEVESGKRARVNEVRQSFSTFI